MPNYKYRLEKTKDSTKVIIDVGLGWKNAAIATVFWPNAQQQLDRPKMEAFSVPADTRGGGASYALVRLLLEEIQEHGGHKSAIVNGVHGALHYTLKNLKFASNLMRPDPTFKPRGNVPFAKKTCDYAIYHIDQAIWFAALKLIEKGVRLVKDGGNGAVDDDGGDRKERI